MLAKVVANEIPNKPIRHAGITHFHYDHIGGIRAMAALGATILVEKGQEPAIRKVLEAPHTHPPDDLAKAGAKAGMIEVYDGKKEIKEGNQSLELIAFTGSPHVDPLVVGYVPSGRVLFNSDIWLSGIGAQGSPEAAHLLESIQKAKLNVSTLAGGHGLVGPFSELTKAVAAMKK
jgi:glyoxylase-like metal-dependent hydrolase (beta-lactamase superfamily II)